MAHIHIGANGLNFGHISWRSYNTIKKKAMEQEFSWSGLLISLFIAFFIVLACAASLNILHQTLADKEHRGSEIKKIYQLEKNNYLNSEVKNIYKNYLA